MNSSSSIQETRLVLDFVALLLILGSEALPTRSIHPLAKPAISTYQLLETNRTRERKPGGAEASQESSDHLVFTPDEGPMGIACSEKMHDLTLRRTSQYIFC